MAQSVFSGLAQDTTLTDGSQRITPWAYDAINDLPTAHAIYLTAKGLRRTHARQGTGLAAGALYDQYVSAASSTYTVPANKKAYVTSITVAANGRVKFDLRKRLGGTTESSIGCIIEIPTGGGTHTATFTVPYDLSATDVLTMQIYNRDSAAVEWSFYTNVVEL